MKDDKLYLIHISECIGRIEQYLPERSKHTFLSSTLLQDAILRNLQTMAESTQRLSDSLKAKHPEINWHKISGFRNLLVHDYLGVDAERVWKIIEIDLPTLKQTISAMLKEGA
jgi:uncharacterized protein with HEPN domain